MFHRFYRYPGFFVIGLLSVVPATPAPPCRMRVLRGHGDRVVTTPSVSNPGWSPRPAGPRTAFEWLRLLQKSGGSVGTILSFMQVEAQRPGKGGTKGFGDLLERGGEIGEPFRRVSAHPASVRLCTTAVVQAQACRLLLSPGATSAAPARPSSSLLESVGLSLVSLPPRSPSLIRGNVKEKSFRIVDLVVSALR